MQDVTEIVEQWIQECVLGLSLCPYAKAPLAAGGVRIAVASADDKQKKSASTEDVFLQCLEQEIEKLLESDQIETTLLIAADGFADFLDFNDFVGYIEKQLASQGIDEYLQLASFHPQYQFAGEQGDDASNYTNRAPLPIVQLLRTESVAEAAEGGDTLAIPERNIERLRSLDKNRLQQLFPWVVGE